MAHRRPIGPVPAQPRLQRDDLLIVQPAHRLVLHVDLTELPGAGDLSGQLGALPLLFAVAPGVGGVKLFGVYLPWLLLGLLSFPFLIGVGWAYVRWAERNEQDFVALIRRPEP